MPKQNKMMQLINQRLRLTLTDGRTLVGQLLAYDKHLNLVIADVEEFRRGRAGEQRRTLGLLMLRGKHVVSMCPEGVPDVNKTRTPAAAQAATSTMASGRGVPAPGAPLAGPAPGMYSMMPGMPMPPRPPHQA